MSTNLPNSFINSIKNTYKELCNENLLRKCLHGKAQNCNESLNNVVLSIIPKDNLVEQRALRLRNYITIILFNFGFAGLLPLLQKLGMKLSSEMKGYFWYLDKTRIVHSKTDEKLSRKKRKALQNCKDVIANDTQDFGMSSTVILEDANALTKCKLPNQRFIKSTILERNFPRNFLSTFARLHTGCFQGMEISPDISVYYPIRRNLPQNAAKGNLPHSLQTCPHLRGLLDQYRNV
ncbi:uncharacterized protein TNCV_289761 [Trichonephila clavipes]|nr:uncharacterized protein TNCV_289761 [Trichonephila clavipes]